jgi:hypothetical protein
MYSFLCIIQNVYSMLMTHYKVEICCTIKHTSNCVYCYYTVTNLDKVNCILLGEKHYCTCTPSRSGQEGLRKNEHRCANDSEHKMNHCVRTILL